MANSVYARRRAFGDRTVGNAAASPRAMARRHFVLGAKRFGGRLAWGLCLAAAFAVGRAAAGEAGGWRVGIGTSMLADAGEAGADAARQAREAFGAGDPKLVLVFAASEQVTPALVAGVAKHFPAELVYGGEVAAPLTPVTNFPDATELDVKAGVGVLALGGALAVTVFDDTTLEADDAGDAGADEGEDEEIAAFSAYRASGRRLGTRLKEAVAACAAPGKLVFTHGDQYNGSNRAFAEGLQEGMGGPAPIVGGAAGNQAAKEIVAGQIRKATNFVVLLCGEFRVGMSIMGGPQMPETADRALALALEQGGGAKPFFGFLYNCRRRRMGMIERRQLGEELAVFQRRLDGVPFFGAYGPGEIGVRRPGAAAEGTGFSVVTALLFPLDAGD